MINVWMKKDDVGNKKMKQKGWDQIGNISDISIQDDKSTICEDGHELKCMEVLPDHGMWCAICYGWFKGK